MELDCAFKLDGTLLKLRECLFI